MPDDNDKPEITVSDIDNSADVIPANKSDVPVNFEQLNAAFIRVVEENEALKGKNDELAKKVKTTEILDNLMKPSANKAFWYMFIYSGSVGLILLMNAFGCFANPMEPEVLKYLVGSTAATVIGLVGMVLTGVFLGARK